jgi:hypothetical protein
MPEYQTVEELLKLAKEQKKQQELVAEDVEGRIKLELAWLQTVAASMGLSTSHRVCGPTEHFPMQQWWGEFIFLVPESIGGRPPRTGGIRNLALDGAGTALMAVAVRPVWYSERRADGRSVIVPHPTEQVELSILQRADDPRSGMGADRQRVIDTVQLRLREAVARHVGLEAGTF